MAFLMVCIQASISASGTLEQLAAALAKSTNNAMSRSGMFQRFHEDTLRFFVSVFYETIQKKLGEPDFSDQEKHFNRIVLEDSTQFKMNMKNAADFPAHGNASGETAGCKVDFAYDLLSNRVLDASLHLATDQDKEIGKQTLSLIRPNDLLMRDMGYFIINEFTEVENLGAYWLSRLPANVSAYVKVAGNYIKLEDYLRTQKKTALDLTVYIGEKERKKVRLVANKVDAATLEKRRRERKQRDAKAKKASTLAMKERDQWHLLVTNIEPEQMKNPELVELYRLRWKIELSFKAWKQSGQVESTLARSSNKHYLESMVIAAMIRFILSFQLYYHLQYIDRACPNSLLILLILLRVI